VTPIRAASLGLVLAGAIASTWLDHAMLSRRVTGTRVLVGDFHVHAYPVDGSLPRWEVQKQAARRGLDVVAITNHNQTIAGRLAPFIDGADVIVLPGQELTTAGFHMALVGVAATVDWRLSASEAIDETHRQGGVAIAAHPVPDSWRTTDAGALAKLDGVEALHQLVHFEPDGRGQLAAFLDRVRAVNPDVAPIGSSDFHYFPDLAACRTYLLVDQRSARGVLEAIRAGRTVAADGRGTLIGRAEHVREVQAQLAGNPPPEEDLRQRLAAIGVLVGLTLLAAFR
jgi:hypothetical protein